MPNITMDDLEEIKNKLEMIFSSEMEVKDFLGDEVPSTEDLPDKNKGLIITDCTILFVDIRSSTMLSDRTQVKNMAKIYRAFARAMSMCIYYSGGRVRQIAGDRVMGVFVDTVGEGSAFKALTAARAIVTVIESIFNPLCKVHVNNKTIECGIGIDTGRVLAASIGIKHEGEDTRDLVWAGKIANVASKHTDLAIAKEIFATDRFYKKLPVSAKKKEDGSNIWSKCYRFKGDSIFEGYCVTEFYLNEIEAQPQGETALEDAVIEKGIDEAKIIASILEGLHSKTTKLLDNFEGVIEREHRVTLREKEVESKEKQLESKVHSLAARELRIEKKEKEMGQTIEFIKNKAVYKINMENLRDTLNTWSFNDFLLKLEELIKLAERIGKSPADCKVDLRYWSLVKFLRQKGELEFAYQCIIEQLTLPVSYLVIPFESDIVEIVKQLGKETLYAEAVLFHVKNYSPDLQTIFQLKKILSSLGINAAITNENQLRLS